MGWLVYSSFDDLRRKGGARREKDGEASDTDDMWRKRVGDGCGEDSLALANALGVVMSVCAAEMEMPYHTSCDCNC